MPQPGSAPVIAARLLTPEPAAQNQPAAPSQAAKPAPTATHESHAPPAAAQADAPAATDKGATHPAPARHGVRHPTAEGRAQPSAAPTSHPASPRSRPAPPATAGKQTAPADHTGRGARPANRPGARPAIRGAAVRARLENALRAHFSYPYVARRNGWQGETDLGLHIGADGRISDVHVVKSSGHRMLDRAALNSARHIKVLPELVDLLYGRALDLVLPVRFRLYDG